ncbi:hypothetical protein HZB94_01115 [Candidatus Falkowbacteria bacterium]|nr:hypothetical protein [Candidatus Falkowbacteria bacterium]
MFPNNNQRERGCTASFFFLRRPRSAFHEAKITSPLRSFSPLRIRGDGGVISGGVILAGTKIFVPYFNALAILLNLQGTQIAIRLFFAEKIFIVAMATTQIFSRSKTSPLIDFFLFLSAFS